MNPATIPYTVEEEHDGRTYTITLPALEIPRCEKCGEMVMDSAANRQISDALRSQLHLLTPEQIRQKREALGLTQEQLANQLRVGAATLSRWETGGQIQTGAMDTLLRLFFAFPDVRAALTNGNRLADLGAGVPETQPATDGVA